MVKVIKAMVPRVEPMWSQPSIFSEMSIVKLLSNGTYSMKVNKGKAATTKCGSHFLSRSEMIKKLREETANK